MGGRPTSQGGDPSVVRGLSASNLCRTGQLRASAAQLQVVWAGKAENPPCRALIVISSPLVTRAR